MRHQLSIITLLLSIFLLSACGFHLKGTQTQALTVEAVYLVLPDDNQSLKQAVEQEFSQQNILLVDESTAEMTVIVSDVFKHRNQTATGGDSGDIREIALTDGFTVRLMSASTILAESTISSRTNIQYSSAQYLGSQTEEANAHEQLALENANKLLRFVAANEEKIAP